MIDLEPTESEFLARARRGLSPSAAQRARVRAGVAVALASVPDPSSASGALARSSKALLGLGAALAIGGAGYSLGHRAGYEAGQREAAPALSIAAAPSTSEAGRASPAPIVAPAPTSNASANAGVVAIPPRPLASGGVGAPDLLDQEVRMLRRVERAQRTDNPLLALSLLDELDRDVPAGKLMEERAAARAIAECAASFGPSRGRLAAEFRRHYAASLYRARVEAACAETDPAPAGD